MASFSHVGSVCECPSGTRSRAPTFDATGLYRCNAVRPLLGELGLSVAVVHARVRRPHAHFLDRLDALDMPEIDSATLVPPPRPLPDLPPSRRSLTA
ncbi:MAG: hypothetical protein M3R63_25430 [Actinomycetota bacterium]|nr:hypothetical protein [Actinomycetota bacterium]